MRVIATLQKHPKIATTIFQMNDKFIVKLEAGNMEQAFKFSTEEIKNLETLDKLLDEAFITKAIERFNEMFLSVKAAKEQLIKSKTI